MVTRLNPYLSFRDSAREAMEFYRSVLGGELEISTFRELGMPVGPGEEDLVMHSMLETPGGLVLMGADTPSSMEYSPGGSISVSLSGDDTAELTGYWEGLVEGATITAPFEVAPWGDLFGMLVDRFGVTWMVNGPAPE
ncbi:VOC family protein [Actinotalea sp.]|uniref:VOC family protein n=1 Tax=Actinotalea sp. TaxID=1872145 RepID=UPI003564BFE4